MTRVAVFLPVLFFQFLISTNAFAQQDQPLRVLMTVGGVDYHTGIVRQLRRNERIDLEVLDFDEDPAVFTAETLADIDAVLMYHRDNTASAEEREALLGFLEAGGGVVVLHHSIANYQDWPAWSRSHVGGLYVLAGNEKLPPSRYFAGFEGVAVKTEPHPVTRRFSTAWRYRDESYEGLWISNKVRTLLQTTAFGSDEQLAWVGPSKTGRVVYIQPGHGDRIMLDVMYFNLLEDALFWAAGKDAE